MSRSDFFWTVFFGFAVGYTLRDLSFDIMYGTWTGWSTFNAITGVFLIVLWLWVIRTMRRKIALDKLHAELSGVLNAFKYDDGKIDYEAWQKYCDDKLAETQKLRTRFPFPWSKIKD